MTTLDNALPLPDPATTGEVVIDRALEAIRTHLGMPIAFLSHFSDGKMVFRNVSAPGLEDLLKPGDHRMMRDVYCSRVADGELPSLIQDTANFQICRDLDITREVPIGSHVSLPIVLSDGSVYGTFCCLSPEPNPSLNERDMAVMAAFASLAAREVEAEVAAKRESAERRQRIQAIIEERAFHPVFQPLVNLETGKVEGVEALTRFDAQTSPNDMFALAAQEGLGVELELATMAEALTALNRLPDDRYLSLNASPALICDERLEMSLPADGRERIVIEVTEHEELGDEKAFLAGIAALHATGIRTAIDDVGAGYSGLQRLSLLAPDILKVDRGLVNGVESAPAKRAMIAALVHFARDTKSKLLVEGVELASEARLLRQLGAQMAQGWLFGKPVRFEDLDLSPVRPITRPLAV